MLSIKKIGILVSIAILFLAPVCAESRRSGFSISPTLGLLYGHAEEIVYKFPNRNLYLSELLWDLKPLAYVGFTIDYGPRDPFLHNGFIASFSFKYGLPFRTGILENRDWLNHSHNSLTHFSQHNAFSRGAFFADISAGYSWRQNNSLALRAYLEFSFMRLSWSGRDGFIQYPPFDIFGNYPPWDSSLPRNYDGLTGEVIRYTQNWFILAPGISLKWKPASKIMLLGNLNYSPLIYCYARDNHVLRDLTFHDYLFFGHYIKGSGELIFPLMENVCLSFKLSYTRISGTRGDAYAGRTRFRQGAGAAYSAFEMGLAARISFAGRY